MEQTEGGGQSLEPTPTPQPTGVGDGPQGLQKQLCRKHTMPSLLPSHNLITAVSLNFSGSKTKARVAEFSF